MRLSRLLPALALLLCACASAPATDTEPGVAPAAAGGDDLTTAEHVDLQRFMGRWFLIADAPTLKEVRKVAVQLEFSLRSNGRISFVTTARELDFVHPPKNEMTEARVARSSNNARWKLDTGWGSSEEFTVIYVDPDYRLAVASNAARSRAWILAREARVTDQTYELLRRRLEAQGFEIDRLLKIPQIEDQFGAPGYR